MSRTPVREAINRLVHEGLLVVLPSRGTMVAKLELNDIAEIYALREVLEGFACRLAAAASPDALLAKLTTLLDTMRQSTKLRDLPTFTHVDMEFHRIIVEQSGNRRLPRLLEPLWTGGTGG